MGRSFPGIPQVDKVMIPADGAPPKQMQTQPTGPVVNPTEIIHHTIAEHIVEPRPPGPPHAINAREVKK